MKSSLEQNYKILSKAPLRPEIALLNVGEEQSGAGVKIRWALKQASCRQHLARAHKMLRPRAQMANENVSSFQYLVCKR